MRLSQVTLGLHNDIGPLKYICDVLCNLVPFVLFKKRGKQPWWSVTFSKVSGFQPATLLKVKLLHGCFSRFLHSTNGTKSYNASHMLTIYFAKTLIVIMHPLKFGSLQSEKMPRLFYSFTVCLLCIIFSEVSSISYVDTLSIYPRQPQ